MGTYERKQRELRAREELILETAREFLMRDGYLGLSMDRLAEAIEYSKPTIYSHFATKEDLLLAMGNAALRQRVELFIRASGFSGRPREKITAIGIADVVFAIAYREHYDVERVLKIDGIWQKATETRQLENRRLEEVCMNTVGGIVGLAIGNGDLDPRQANPSLICEGLRAMSIGTHMVLTFRNRTQDEVEKFYGLLHRNQHHFLDGCGMKPLYKDWDYAGTVKRILSEIFPEEAPNLPESIRCKIENTGSCDVTAP